jgi:hypothetical protein
VAKENGVTGALTLVAGAPGPDGIASLSIGSDAVVAVALINDTFACLSILAAGSAGKLDCDGGQPVDVDLTVDSNGLLAPGDAMLSTEQGGPGPAGAGYVTFTLRGANCPGDASGACVGTVDSPDDCADPTKVDYGVATAGTLALTTGTSTVTITEPRQGGANPTITRTGAPFDCASWMEDAAGIVEIGIPAFDTILGDAANMLQLDD